MSIRNWTIVGRAVEQLAGLGHRVETCALPLDLDFFTLAWPQIGQMGLASMFDQHQDWAQQASSKYRDMAEVGRQLPGSRLWQIIDRVKLLRRECAVLFARVDVIVMPSVAALPWPAEAAFPTQIRHQTCQVSWPRMVQFKNWQAWFSIPFGINLGR